MATKSLADKMVEERMSQPQSAPASDRSTTAQGNVVAIPPNPLDSGTQAY